MKQRDLGHRWWWVSHAEFLRSMGLYYDALVDVFEPKRRLCNMAEVMLEEDFVSLSLAVEWGSHTSCMSLALSELVPASVLPVHGPGILSASKYQVLTPGSSSYLGVQSIRAKVS